MHWYLRKHQHQIIEIFFLPSTFLCTQLTALDLITCTDLKETLLMGWVGNPHYSLHRGETGNPRLRGICRQGALLAQTSQDRQQQVGTHHWSSWCPPSQAHTDRCLEQCSDHGHIYLHSGLSERKINQMRDVGTRKTPQQHSCFPSRS